MPGQNPVSVHFTGGLTSHPCRPSRKQCWQCAENSLPFVDTSRSTRTPMALSSWGPVRQGQVCHIVHWEAHTTHTTQHGCCSNMQCTVAAAVQCSTHQSWTPYLFSHSHSQSLTVFVIHIVNSIPSFPTSHLFLIFPSLPDLSFLGFLFC